MPFGQTLSPHAEQNQQNAQNAYQSALAAALPTIQGDISSGNFGGAFSTAEGLPTPSWLGVQNTALQALASKAGLQALDPSMQWTPQSINAYYQAAMTPQNWSAITSVANPYSASNTGWGSGSKAAADAAANISAGGAPDIGRFAGYNEADSGDLFSNLVGIITHAAPALILGAAMPAAIPALAADLGGSTLAAGALYGAGSGALESAVNGGNVGKGALLGALTGGIQGSGAVQGLMNSGDAALTSAGLPGWAANGITNGLVGAGTGAIRGAVTGTGAGEGALLGGLSGATGGALKGYFAGQDNGNPLTTTQTLISNAAAGAVPGIITGNPGASLAGAVGGAGNSIAPGLGTLGATLVGMSGFGQPGHVSAPNVGNVTPFTQSSGAPASVSTGAPVTASTSTPMTSTAPATSSTSPGQPTSAATTTATPAMVRQQANPAIDYYAYGQGPEAQFFAAG